jgi:hypothetical protein
MTFYITLYDVNVPVDVSNVHDVFNFWSTFADERRQVLHVDASVGTLA